MSAKHLLLVGSLALLLSGCSGHKASHAPPPLNKELLPGKWKNTADGESAMSFQLVTGYEFAGDGRVKVTIAGMEEPLAAKYTWSSDRNLELEYPAEADVRQAYASAVKSFKDRFMQRIKAGQIPDQAVSSLKAIRDVLPAKETFTVAISEKPVQLFLTAENGTSLSFRKVD